MSETYSFSKEQLKANRRKTLRQVATVATIALVSAVLGYWLKDEIAAAGLAGVAVLVLGTLVKNGLERRDGR